MFLKLLGPVTPVLDALVTPHGYTVAAQVAPRHRVKTRLTLVITRLKTGMQCTLNFTHSMPERACNEI